MSSTIPQSQIYKQDLNKNHADLKVIADKDEKVNININIDDKNKAGIVAPVQTQVIGATLDSSKINTDLNILANTQTQMIAHADMHIHSDVKTKVDQKIDTNINITTEVPTTTLKTVDGKLGIVAEVPTTGLKNVTTSMPVVAEVGTATTKKIMQNVDVVAEVPITTTKTVTTNVPVTAEVPVTVIKHVKRQVEVETEVPVTILKKVKKIIEVDTEIPVTELKQVTTTVPVTTEVPVQTMKKVHTTVPVETEVPVTGKKMVTANIDVDTTVPVPGVKQVETSIPIESTIPSEGGIKINSTNIPLHSEAHIETKSEVVASGHAVTTGISNFTQNLNQKSEKILHAETKNVIIGGHAVATTTIPKTEVIIGTNTTGANVIASNVKTVETGHIIGGANTVAVTSTSIPKSEAKVEVSVHKDGVFGPESHYEKEKIVNGKVVEKTVIDGDKKVEVVCKNNGKKF